MSSIPAELQKAIDKSVEAQRELVPSTQRLDDAVRNSKVHGLPPIAIGAAQGSFQAMLCRMMNAKAVLEIGTLGGYSTIWLATSVPGIQVTSIEYNQKHCEVARENIQGLENVDIIHGAALDVLPELAGQGKVFDFIFIDADWAEQHLYFDWAVKLARPGSCIFVDNAVRQLTESDDPEGRALVEYVSKDERVHLSTLLLQINTVKAEHGDPKLDELADGFVMALVK